MPTQSQSRRVKVGIGLLAAVAMMGCGRERSVNTGDELEVRSASFQSRPADEMLAGIFLRYRNASSYHDRAIVRLSYESNGRWESETAPLGVWFDHNRLSIEAYDVRLWSADNTVISWIVDESTQHFDSQVLKFHCPGHRPDLSTLLVDPTLIDRLGAGLAGPPPQLEWLFAADPMKHLFQPAHQFSFGRTTKVAGHECVSIRVDAGGDRYQFWIDSKLRLIRRVDLPSPGTKLGLASDSVQLSVELIDASFDPPGSDRVLDPLPARPKFVRAFVRLAPEQPSGVLGDRVRPFRLEASDSSFTLTERGSDRPITVLARYSGDYSSRSSAAALQTWAAMISGPLRQSVRVVLVADDDGTARVPSDLAVPHVVDYEGRVAAAFAWEPGALAVLDPQGRVAWLQQDLTSEGLVALGAVVGDVLNRVDVPSRLREQWRDGVRAYQARLAEQRIPAN